MMKKEDQLLGIHHVTAMTSDAEKLSLLYRCFRDAFSQKQ